MCFNVSHTAAWDSFQFSYKPISESCAKEFYNERSVKMNANTRSNISNVCLKLENSFRPIVHSPSSSYIENHIAICAVNALFSIVGTILNSLVLYIFWKSPQRRPKMSSFVIMMLCSIDLGVVTIVQPLFTDILFNQWNFRNIEIVSYIDSFWATSISISCDVCINSLNDKHAEESLDSSSYFSPHFCHEETILDN